MPRRGPEDPGADGRPPPVAGWGGRLLRLVSAGFWAGWVAFTLWLLTWGMLLSAAWAAAFAWSTRPWAPPRRLRSALLLLGGLLWVGAVGLPEYAATANALHCRTLGFTGQSPKAHTACDPDDLAAGRAVAKNGGPLFSPRERLAVHGFNVLMALGGYATGLPEVAHETLWLSLVRDPSAADGGTVALSARARRKQCLASSGKATALAPDVHWDSDFFLRSGVVRTAVAGALPRLGRKAGSTVQTRGLHWVKSGNYLWSLTNDSARVALALEVADSKVELERRADGRVVVRWVGTIHYPPTDTNLIDVPLPTLRGPTRLRLSETIFCGMHIDGAMNPYRMVWETTIDEDDPRLASDNRGDSQVSLLHRLAGWGLVDLPAQLGL